MTATGTYPGTPTPAATADRSRVWADALFAAVAALQGQLTHSDPAVVQQVASALIDLEKTRLRHGRELCGTTVESGPHTPCADHSPDCRSVAPSLRDGPLPPLPELTALDLPDDAEEEVETEEVPGLRFHREATESSRTKPPAAADQCGDDRSAAAEHAERLFRAISHKFRTKSEVREQAAMT